MALRRFHLPVRSRIEEVDGRSEGHRVGTGFGARVVAPAFAAAAGCEVVDVVSPRDDVAVARAIERLDVDLVSVHSPPFLHAAHVRAALAAGKAVLCDKPFAMDADEARALADEAAAGNAIALCNFEFRFHPVRRLLRELVRTNKLGRIEHVQWTHLSAGSRVPMRRYGWLFDRSRGGGWIGAWASHAVDTIRWCFGEITGVDARSRIDVTERPDDQGRMHDVHRRGRSRRDARGRRRDQREHRQHVRRQRDRSAPPRGHRRERGV